MFIWRNLEPQLLGRLLSDAVEKMVADRSLRRIDRPSANASRQPGGTSERAPAPGNGAADMSGGERESDRQNCLRDQQPGRAVGDQVRMRFDPGGKESAIRVRRNVSGETSCKDRRQGSLGRG
jgi:hypothetical protein